MTHPWAQRILDAATRTLPERPVHLARQIRWLLRASPAPWDEAATALYEAERRAKGGLAYPYYLYGLLSAARTAVAAGHRSFTAVELGVAGGNGLRALEQHAETIEASFPLRVSVVGFDSGAGLLEAEDPRDGAFALRPGDFAMNEEELRGRLTRAELVLGDVGDTFTAYMASAADRRRPPLGFVSCDLDVYTGTLAALTALRGDADLLLPRVPMYFDDLAGYPYSTEVGEWAAIRSFNEAGTRRIGQILHLEHTLGGAAHFALWPRQFFLLHVFDHPSYNAPEKAQMESLRLL